MMSHMDLFPPSPPPSPRPQLQSNPLEFPTMVIFYGPKIGVFMIGPSPMVSARVFFYLQFLRQSQEQRGRGGAPVEGEFRGRRGGGVAAAPISSVRSQTREVRWWEFHRPNRYYAFSPGHCVSPWPCIPPASALCPPPQGGVVLQKKTTPPLGEVGPPSFFCINPPQGG